MDIKNDIFNEAVQAGVSRSLSWCKKRYMMGQYDMPDDQKMSRMYILPSISPARPLLTQVHMYQAIHSFIDTIHNNFCCCLNQSMNSIDYGQRSFYFIK